MMGPGAQWSPKVKTLACCNTPLDSPTEQHANKQTQQGSQTGTENTVWIPGRASHPSSSHQLTKSPKFNVLFSPQF